jgi:hypothetical protein
LVHTRCLSQIILNCRLLPAEDMSENTGAIRSLRVSQIATQIVEDAAIVILVDGLVKALGPLRLRSRDRNSAQLTHSRRQQRNIISQEIRKVGCS